MSTINPLKKLLDNLTAEEKVTFAEAAKVSVQMLYTMGKAYRTQGKLTVKAGLSRRLELASIALAKLNPKVKILRREELTPDCKQCEFLRECRKRQADEAKVKS